MAKLIRLKLYICDFYENLDKETMEVIIHQALNGGAGSAMTDMFEIEEKVIKWADDNPINQFDATQKTWDEQFGSKDTQAARIAELEAAIRRCCRNCWAAPAPDAAQCRVCGLKGALKGTKNE